MTTLKCLTAVASPDRNVSASPPQRWTPVAKSPTDELKNKLIRVHEENKQLLVENHLLEKRTKELERKLKEAQAKISRQGDAILALRRRSRATRPPPPPGRPRRHSQPLLHQHREHAPAYRGGYSPREHKARAAGACASTAWPRLRSSATSSRREQPMSLMVAGSPTTMTDGTVRYRPSWTWTQTPTLFTGDVTSATTSSNGLRRTSLHLGLDDVTVPAFPSPQGSVIVHSSTITGYCPSPRPHGSQSMRSPTPQHV